MASKRFKKLLLLRFIAYFSILTGFVVIVIGLGPVISAETTYRWDKIQGIKYSLGPKTVITSSGEDESTASASFGELSSTQQLITPVSPDYGIVIEKINANAKIVPDVDIVREAEYVKALQLGVAEAKGSTKPGENGNLFLFSHSTDAPWNIVRYNAIFYLLRELEAGDRVIVFYQGRRYDYVVFDKAVVRPSDISYLTNRYDKPVLTLQTCDPPGTLINRLVVRARLAKS